MHAYAAYVHRQSFNVSKNVDLCNLYIQIIRFREYTFKRNRLSPYYVLITETTIEKSYTSTTIVVSEDVNLLNTTNCTNLN